MEDSRDAVGVIGYVDSLAFSPRSPKVEGGLLQFGRYHGIALAALGLLLIGLQVIIGSAKPPRATDATSTRTLEHKTIVPGVIGGGLFVVGLFFVIIARRGDKPPDERAVK